MGNGIDNAELLTRGLPTAARVGAYQTAGLPFPDCQLQGARDWRSETPPACGRLFYRLGIHADAETCEH